jgi:hypothetical protein
MWLSVRRWSCDLWLLVVRGSGLLFCLWHVGPGGDCLILGCVPPYLLGYSVCRFIFHSPSTSPSFSAEDGDTRRPTRRSLRRRLATRGFRGRRGLRGEALLPSASLPVSWICSLFLLFGDVLPLILCGFASFHCLLHVVAVYDLALGFHFPARWVWFL